MKDALFQEYACVCLVFHMHEILSENACFSLVLHIHEILLIVSTYENISSYEMLVLV